MAVTTNVTVPSPQMKQMSSDFMARRKVYEQDDTHLVYTTVAKITAARSGSPQFFNATPKPAPRKAQAVSAVPEALPRMKSEESLRKEVVRNSLEVRPSVPKRSSSIRSRRNHRSKDLRSLNLQNPPFFSSLDGSASQTDQQRESVQSDNALEGTRHSISLDRTSFQLSKTVVNPEAPVIREDSPLGFTLARKRSSMPSIEYKPDTRMSLLEARIAERDSGISHRDRESFLASFPQPPKSSQQRPVLVHRRNSSSQNYSLFPRSPPANETSFDKDASRQTPRQSHEKQSSVEQLSALPQVKDEDEDVRPHTARPAVTATTPTSALTYDHPNMSFSNPDFSDGNLQLDLNPFLSGLASNTETRPETRPSENVKYGGSQVLRKRAVTKANRRWGFGSLSGDRVSYYERQNGKATEPSKDMSGSNVEGQNTDKLDMCTPGTATQEPHLDEKYGVVKHTASQGGLRKKASDYFRLKEQTSSTSINKLLEKTGHVQPKTKKSLLKRILCW